MPARRRTATCRDCGDPILWVVTATRGSRMPLDASPDEEGVFRILARSDDGLVAEPLGGAELAAARADGALLFAPHWRSCSARKPHNPCPPAARQILRDAGLPGTTRRGDAE